ncbi:hypothetical protein GXW82_13535 [Streptacidiphilus sp. 4-A2]|nr:hypothetical protein [Streptacidiphilus sp. 4-A2]
MPSPRTRRRRRPLRDADVPGFDVFLAEKAGLVELPPRTGYAGLARHPHFAARMSTHAQRCLGGSLEEDCFGARSTDYFCDQAD